ncbi:hypothetical protein Ciccas_002942 [Cichlidogyrus casuarinus]|uniref:Uncharacterized protein n=1 Tax=Cichlidogyrus casuarinus TaxID=1844966 RepID=A0ABD2QG78_9PLAT
MVNVRTSDSEVRIFRDISRLVDFNVSICGRMFGGKPQLVASIAQWICSLPIDEASHPDHGEWSTPGRRKRIITQ